MSTEDGFTAREADTAAAWQHSGDAMLPPKAGAGKYDALGDASGPSAASVPAPSSSATLNGDGRARVALTVIERRSMISVHPDKTFRVIWEVVGVVMLVWMTLDLPFKLAFLSEELNDKDPAYVFQVFVDIYFILDVALNFYTGYYDENDTLVMDTARIKAHYVRSWFVIDFLGAIPFDYLVLLFAHMYITALQGTKSLRLLKLLRLFRMLRITNLYRFLGRYEENFSQSTIKIFKLAMTLLLWLHFDACMFFFVARWSEMDSGEWDSASWVVRNGVDILPVPQQYLYALWHAISHMISVSYGPMNPIRIPEIVATMLSLLAGAMLYASIIGTTSSIIQQSDPSGSEFYKQWDELKAFMRYKELPGDVRDRLRKYFNMRWRSRQVFDENVILSSLPPPYARSVIMHECRGLLKSLPLLQQAHEGFVSTLVSYLQAVLIMEGENVIQDAEPPLRWWLISSGVVSLYRDGRKFAELSDGQYFGDISLLWGVKSPFLVQTDVPTQFYALDRVHFESLMGEYPDLVSRLKAEGYKQCRRWGIADALREAAGRGEHASAFTRIPFDWDAAEAELRAEAEAKGEVLDAPNDLFDRDWSHSAAVDAYLSRARADSGGGLIIDGVDVFAHLRKRFQDAGAVLRRLPSDLQHRDEGGPGGLGHMDTHAFMNRLRAFGQGMETRAARLGAVARDNLRNVRDRIVQPVLPGSPTGQRARTASFMSRAVGGRRAGGSARDVELASASAHAFPLPPHLRPLPHHHGHASTASAAAAAPVRAPRRASGSSHTLSPVPDVEDRFEGFGSHSPRRRSNVDAVRGAAGLHGWAASNGVDARPSASGSPSARELLTKESAATAAATPAPAAWDAFDAVHNADTHSS